MEVFNYLFKVSICLAVLYLLYYFAFRKLTFFTFNRLYLLIAILISLILPAINIKVAVELPEVIFAIPTALKSGIEQKEDFELTRPVKEAIDWLLFVQYIYFFITMCLLMKLFRSIALIHYKAKRNSQKIGKYYHVKDETAEGYCSFFNIIFLNKGHTDQEQIIAHEKIHSRLLHSADHLFAEIVSAFLWFNPFIYLLKKDLYQIHEFEVDRHLTRKYEVKSYAELLLKLATTDKLNLENGFSTIGVKSRIEMLFKSPSAKQTRFFYILIIPVVFGLTYFFTIENTYANQTLPDGFVLIVDAGHGGKDAGGISKTGHQEKDITLQMAAVLQSLAAKKGIATVLTRSKDEFVRLKDRAQVKGSIFISLHMKAGVKDEELTGFEIGYCGENSHSSSSYKLAQLTQKHLERISEMKTSKEFMHTNYLLLRENRSPGILIEMGDLNQKPDIDFMLNRQKQGELAEKILLAVQLYGAE